MKKLLIFISFVLASVVAKAQYPIQQNLGSGSAIVSVPYPGALRAMHVNGVFIKK